MYFMIYLALFIYNGPPYHKGYWMIDEEYYRQLLISLSLKEHPSGLPVPHITATLANVLHAYYMCDTHVIHVWYFTYITLVIHTPVMHV